MKPFDIIELENIKLDDYEYYKGSRGKYYSILKKWGITTVAQLLNDDVMFEILSHCGSNTYKDLEMLISLTKYKYLNIPLSTDALLDKKIIFDEDKRIVIIDNNYRREFSSQYDFGLDRFSWYFEARFYDTIIKKENLKLVDYLNYLLNGPFNGNNVKSDNKNYNAQCSILSTILESYEKSKKKASKNDDIDNIEELRKQLSILYEEKKKIDSQIDQIMEKIDTVLKDNKGGMKK